MHILDRYKRFFGRMFSLWYSILISSQLPSTIRRNFWLLIFRFFRSAPDSINSFLFLNSCVSCCASAVLSFWLRRMTFRGADSFSLISEWVYVASRLKLRRKFSWLIAKRSWGYFGLLLLFLLRRQFFITTIWRHCHFKSAFCSFIHAISTELRAWRHFSLILELVFFVHWRD